jgi:hypothetical protein
MTSKALAFVKRREGAQYRAQMQIDMELPAMFYFIEALIRAIERLMYRGRRHARPSEGHCS